MLYYCQFLIDYEIPSLNENFFNNENFLGSSRNRHRQSKVI